MKSLAIWSPRPQAKTREQLTPSITIYGLPVIDIKPKPFDATLCQQSEALIFVSQHAVRHAVPHIPIEILRKKVLIAIGKRTAEALASFSLVAHITAPPPHNSEALLADKQFKRLSCRRYALICGVGGRALLETSLQKRHHQVCRVACYQRDKVNLSSQTMIQFIIGDDIGGIILSSVEITTTVALLLRASGLMHAFHLPAFALSERIAAKARAMGFGQVVVADRANQHFLYQCIKHWWEGTQR